MSFAYTLNVLCEIDKMKTVEPIGFKTGKSLLKLGFFFLVFYIKNALERGTKKRKMKYAAIQI